MGSVLLALLFVHGRGDVWIIYAVTLLYGARDTRPTNAVALRDFLRARLRRR